MKPHLPPCYVPIRTNFWNLNFSVNKTLNFKKNITPNDRFCQETHKKQYKIIHNPSLNCFLRVGGWAKSEFRDMDRTNRCRITRSTFLSKEVGSDSLILGVGPALLGGQAGTRTSKGRYDPAANKAVARARTLIPLFSPAEMLPIFTFPIMKH